MVALQWSLTLYLLTSVIFIDSPQSNESFPEFGWKSWRNIVFFPALAGNAGILFWA